MSDQNRVFEILNDIEHFIDEIQKEDDHNEKRLKLFRNQQFFKWIWELRGLDGYQFDRIIEEINQIFPKSKTDLKDKIKRKLEEIEKSQVKEHLNKFTDADIESLPMKNGQLVATPGVLERVLLGAKRIKFVYDTISHKVYFSQIDWDELEKPFELPLVGTDKIDQYHRYTGSTVNQTRLKTILGVDSRLFPNEIHFSALDDAVEIVAKRNQVDFYQRWMESAEGLWDGIDRYNGENCWVVKHFWAEPNEWTYAWARVFMLTLVNRCFEPGCQIRYWFAIQGAQAIGKTKLCESIVPENWYVSTSLNLANHNEVEFYRTTYDRASVELPELGNLPKVDQNVWKRITTERKCTFRDLYKPVVDHPKRSIYIVTTNDAKFLRDPTGETRAAPINLTMPEGTFVNWELFQKEYPQILSQAIHMYRNGNNKFFSQEEILLQKDETAKRDTTDETFEYQVINDYLNEDNYQEIADVEGIYLDRVYNFMYDKYQMPKHIAMKHSRLLGRALVKFGYESDGKCIIFQVAIK